MDTRYKAKRHPVVNNGSQKKERVNKKSTDPASSCTSATSSPSQFISDRPPEIIPVDVHKAQQGQLDAANAQIERLIASLDLAGDTIAELQGYIEKQKEGDVSLRAELSDLKKRLAEKANLALCTLIGPEVADDHSVDCTFGVTIDLSMDIDPRNPEFSGFVQGDKCPPAGHDDYRMAWVERVFTDKFPESRLMKRYMYLLYLRTLEADGNVFPPGSYTAVIGKAITGSCLLKGTQSKDDGRRLVTSKFYSGLALSKKGQEEFVSRTKLPLRKIIRY